MDYVNGVHARVTRYAISFVVSLLSLLILFTAPSYAISFGEPDGTDHPSVGTIVLTIPGLGEFNQCSGTLISERVFLTAAHCTVALDRWIAAVPGTTVRITFDPTVVPGGTYYTGVWHTNPNYNGWQGPDGASNPGDVAVIVLDSAPPGITPSRLPSAGMLDRLKAGGVLRHTRFTTVGYGTVRDTIRGGFDAIMVNLDRNRAEQGYNSLTAAWLRLQMTSSNGNGGTCYGDSGGPHFIHLDGVETDIIASITVAGDAPCKANDATYRMDTPSARNFLGTFVTLP